jgi:hypothetical protein
LKCSQLRCLGIVGVYSPALCSSTCAIRNRLYLIKQTSMSHMQPNTSCKGFFLCIGKPRSWTVGRRTSKLQVIKTRREIIHFMLMICIDDKTKENKKITHVGEGKYHQ